MEQYTLLLNILYALLLFFQSDYLIVLHTYIIQFTLLERDLC